MDSLFPISPRLWAVYAGLFVVGLGAHGVGLWSGNAHDEYKRFLIVGFAAFVMLLFFIFFSALRKKWKMPIAIYTPFVMSHAALAVLGFGVIPIMLYERSLLDKGFFLFTPTGIFTLAMASAAAFFCYWILSRTLGGFCRFGVRAIFARMESSVRQNKTLIICVLFVLFFVYMTVNIYFGQIAAGDDVLFLFGLLITPFMMYAFSLFTDHRYIAFTSVLTVLFAAAYGLLMVQSTKYEKMKVESGYVDSIVILSRHFFIAHLVAWAVYMKILGIVFQFGSRNPFQF